MFGGEGWGGIFGFPAVLGLCSLTFPKTSSDSRAGLEPGLSKGTVSSGLAAATHHSSPARGEFK